VNLEALRLIPIEKVYDKVYDFVNEHIEQLGYVRPIDKERFVQQFSRERSYALLKENEIVCVFSYISGFEKTSPTGFIRFVVSSPDDVKVMLKHIIRIATSQEKLYLRVSRFGYDQAVINTLCDLGFKVGAEIPNMVSYEVQLYNYYILYFDLRNQYSFDIERRYKEEELYPLLPVEKAKSFSFRIRGLQYEDFTFSERIFNQPNVFRTMGRGVFEGLIHFDRDSWWRGVLRREYYSLVCVDEVSKRPIGFLSIGLNSQDVLKGVGNIGMFVDEKYHGLGAGSLLMENAILLGKRLHLRMLTLSVFNINPIGIRLYKKFKFKEYGRVPGWFQNGYIEEIMMARTL